LDLDFLISDVLRPKPHVLVAPFLLSKLIFSLFFCVDIQSKIGLLSTFPYLGYFVCTAALNDYQERTTIALSILNKMHYGSTI